MLVALVLGRGEVVSTDRLIEALWGDTPPRSAVKTLQNYVLRLRKALGPAVIQTRPPGYCLAMGEVTIDVASFDRLAHDGREARRNGRPKDAVVALRQALDLWRGSPLEELEGWDDCGR